MATTQNGVLKTIKANQNQTNKKKIETDFPFLEGIPFC